jgi:hypothetical protein
MEESADRPLFLAAIGRFGLPGKVFCRFVLQSWENSLSIFGAKFYLTR